MSTTARGCCHVTASLVTLTVLVISGSRLLELGGDDSWRAYVDTWQAHFAAASRGWRTLREGPGTLPSRGAGLSLGVPWEYATWHDEEDLLLRRSLGHRGWPQGARQPSRRRALWGRPWECDKPNGTYPSEAFRERDLINWVPQPDRYLLAACHSGQLSNQIMCMMNGITYAAVLNRTFVVPYKSFARGFGQDSRFGWTWDLALDIPRAQECLGANAVVPLAELAARAGGTVAVDALMCFEADHCRPERDWDLEALNITLPPAGGAAPPPLVFGDKYRKPEDLRAAVAFAGGARVLLFADLYAASLQVPHHAQDPIRSKCGGGSYFRSHPAIRAAAEGFAWAVLGGNDFVAIHLRRQDFYGWRKSVPWFEVPRLARFLARVAAARNVTRVFLATNAHLLEVDLLDRLLKVGTHGRLQLVVLPNLSELPPSVTLPWAKPWLDLRLDSDIFARAILDKLVCTHARLFIGSIASTFTNDVFRIRKVEGRVTCHDGLIQNFGVSA